ncbi:MAG: methyltransferase domain-containing protein [Mariprofundaceae bacterium]|nr:methyltransferase domain-containing protein [Mariprofundaceae bacterium]
MKIYRHFIDGMPWYLAKYYWWAYLWSKSVWFFDHQPIINAILFFQYQKLMQATLSRFKGASKDSVLQLTCVYGSLTPNLSQVLGSKALHITDAANIQLQLASSKCHSSALLPTRMNAEQLGYKDNTFNTIILFFLLHEMPHEARVNTISECMRVLDPNGSLIITEYAPLPKHHWLYQFPLFRCILTTLEPFLVSFWHEDLEQTLKQHAATHGKDISCVSQQKIFHDFYRVSEYKVAPKRC